MDLLGTLGLSYDRIISSVGEAIDSVVTSDEERLRLQNELIRIKQDQITDSRKFAIALEEQVTNRWNIDKDSFLTRSVRPAIVVWSLGLLTFAMIADGNLGEFAIAESYIPMLSTIVQTTIIAYFGSRGVEKVTRITKG